MSDPAPSIATLIDGFIAHLGDERRLSPRTLDAYRRDLTRMLQYAATQDVRRAVELSPDHLRAFVASQHRRGLSARSIQRVLCAIRSFFRWLARETVVEANPAQGVRAPKARKRLPKTLDTEEISQLLDLPGNDPLTVRDRALLELFYSSGLRLAELAALNWQDLAVEEAVVRVTGKGDKVRIVPVGRKALAALAQWRDVHARLAANQQRVFLSRRGTPLSHRAIQSRVRARAEQKGLWKRVHPHMLRHSFASHMLESSGQLRALQELLGHADITTTQVYTHLDYQHLAKVYDQAHPRARQRKGATPPDPDGD